MVHIVVDRGLDVPLSGKPNSDAVRLRVPLGVFSCDLSSCDRGVLLVDEGQRVSAGGAIGEDHGRPIVSPVGATVKQIIRGAKRRPLAALLDPEPGQQDWGAEASEGVKGPPVDGSDRDTILERLVASGLFGRLRVRPGNRAASPDRLPRSIFVQAVETAPYTPPAEWQVQGREEAFQVGLSVLKRLTEGSVHVVVAMGSPLIPLCAAASVHTVYGPHPAANPSVHIQQIDPIRSAKDVVWTLSAIDVVAIGQFYLSGSLWVDVVVAVAGTGFTEHFRKYVRAFPGVSVDALASGGLVSGAVRLISGDPLTGFAVSLDGFLNPRHTVLSAIPEGDPKDREFLRFFKPRVGQFTATKTYLSRERREYDFTTKAHGDVRPFIDGSVYEKVLPFHVLPVPMIKAILADDLDKAVHYGLLEVVPEDFALADFICPSKIDMMSAVREAHRKYFSSL